MSFKEELLKLSKAVVAKGTELGKIAKLKHDISELDELIKRKKIIIADIVIEKGIKVDNKDITNFIEEINDLRSRIKVMEIQIKDIETNKEKVGDYGSF